MIQTMRCIKFGEVLLDENRRAFLVCLSCHKDFAVLEEFRKHLETCAKDLFVKNRKLVFQADKGKTLMSNSSSGRKKLRVYDYKEVQKLTPPTVTKQQSINPTMNLDKEDNYMDLINIEEELLNPRWYTDLNYIGSTSTDNPSNKVLAYNELVEAVTPYVQFKENVKTCDKKMGKYKPVAKALNTQLPTQEQDKATNSIQNATAGKQTKAIETKTFTIVRKREKQDAKDGINFGNTHITLKQPAGVTASVNAKRVPTVTNDPQLVEKRRKLMVSLKDNLQKHKIATQTENTNIKLVKPQTEHTNIKLVEKETSVSANEEKVHQSQSGKICRSSGNILSTGLKVFPVTNYNVTTHQRQHPKTQAPQQISLVTNIPSMITATTQPIRGGIGQKQQTPSLAVAQMAVPKQQQTALILNKLQTLGLQVKRTLPAKPAASCSAAKSNETQQLLEKLQSKGIKIVTTKPAEAALTNLPHVMSNNTHNLQQRIIIRKIN